MQTSSLRLMLIASLGASLVACGGDPPDPATVRQGLQQNLGAVLPELVAALQSDATARVPLDSAQRLFDMIDAGSTAPVATLLPRASSVRSSVRSSVQSSFQSSFHALAADSTIDATKLSSWLVRNLFTDANHRGDGVFRIPPQLVCATSFDPETGDPGPVLDDSCVQTFNKVEPKIRVRGDAQDLEFSLLLGPSENEPFSLELTKSSVDFRIDLGEAQQAVAELSTIFGENPPNLRASGQVAFGLKVLGKQHVVFKTTIERAVELAFAEGNIALDSAGALRFASAAATVTSIEIDGTAGSLKASLALGVTKLHTPSGPVGSGASALDVDLPGLTGALTVAPGQPVKLTGLGLGNRTFTVDVDGRRAVTIDLNPESGRSFDATISENAGVASFAITPSFDLRMNVNATALGQPAAPYQVTRILLDGTTPTLTTQGSLLKVSSGHFAISTDPATYGLDANAGQCVKETLVAGSTTSRLEITPCL
jgi:hypothetical protein